MEGKKRTRKREHKDSGALSLILLEDFLSFLNINIKNTLDSREESASDSNGMAQKRNLTERQSRNMRCCLKKKREELEWNVEGSLKTNGDKESVEGYVLNQNERYWDSFSLDSIPLSLSLFLPSILKRVGDG